MKSVLTIKKLKEFIKNCNSNNICKVKLIKSKVAEELTRSILTTAAKLDKQ